MQLAEALEEFGVEPFIELDGLSALEGGPVPINIEPQVVMVALTSCTVGVIVVAGHSLTYKLRFEAHSLFVCTRAHRVLLELDGVAKRLVVRKSVLSDYLFAPSIIRGQLVLFTFPKGKCF